MEKYKCLICKLNFNRSNIRSQHLKKVHQLTPEQYYNKFFELKQFCKNCGKDVEFLSIKNGYRSFCSYKCSSSSLETIKKRSNTNLKKYGYVVSVHNKKIRKKIVENWKKKYGVDHPWRNK